jgi:nucleotide-binding universal stress UspA family protein
VVQVARGPSPEDEPQFYRRLERKADEALARHLDRLKTKGPPARAAVLLCDRVPEVLRLARESGVDLIVLTSHAVDPAQPGAEWGTLSYLIGIAAQCPVLLVK